MENGNLELSSHETNSLFRFLLSEYAKEENFGGFNLDIGVSTTGHKFYNGDELIRVVLYNTNNGRREDITNNSEYENDLPDRCE